MSCYATAQLEFGRAIGAFEFGVGGAQMRLAALQLRDRALQIGNQKVALHNALLERGRLARVLLCLLRELDRVGRHGLGALGLQRVLLLHQAPERVDNAVAPPLLVGRLHFDSGERRR